MLWSVLLDAFNSSWCLHRALLSAMLSTGSFGCFPPLWRTSSQWQSSHCHCGRCFCCHKTALHRIRTCPISQPSLSGISLMMCLVLFTCSGIVLSFPTLSSHGASQCLRSSCFHNSLSLSWQLFQRSSCQPPRLHRQIIHHIELSSFASRLRSQNFLSQACWHLLL